MTQLSQGLTEIAQNYSTVVDVLRHRSLTQPQREAFTFLLDGEIQAATLTYQELDQRSRAIASQLQAMGMSGERVLLLYLPGLDFLTAFFGCLYAGVVAVPAYPPHNQRNTPRVQAIVADAQAKMALTTTALLPKLQSLLSTTTTESLQWLATDNLPENIETAWQEPNINQDSLAFLQYTSGSTGTPKGVILSHSNLLHNAAMTYQFMEHSPDSKFVSWLPVYHDMGLIGGILQPLYGGFPCVLMAPALFLQSPYRWLQTISYYQGTTSGGPNFAYELCVQKITPEQKKTLDLTSWSVAFNGAEPIRHETLERFAATFAKCGFRKESFYPCYGMAEATLMVSGVAKTASPTIKTVNKSALSQNQIIEARTDQEDIQNFVGCGYSLPQQNIVIAHPETLQQCQPHEVGEIWVSGPSVGQGYWRCSLETDRIFHAYVQDTKQGPFLRTGDLGFLDNGELFITGRLKDLIIIRGRNLYPQDIELTTERSHPLLRAGAGAAFAVEVDNEERLVVVQELEFRAKPNIDEVTAKIRQAVAEAHEIQVYAVVLIKAGTIPKTSSGKIQRRATKKEYLAGNLNVIGSSILDSVDSEESEPSLTREVILAAAPQQQESLLISYLRQKIAQILGGAAFSIDLEQPLTSLGLDSLKVFEVKNHIEAICGINVSVVDLFQSSSIKHLVTQILERLATASQSSGIVHPQPRTENLPLSYAQQRLWYLQKLQPDSSFYNIAVALDLKGVLNIQALESSFNAIVQRHEALHTSFKTVDGTPKQEICPSVSIEVPVVDLRNFAASDRPTELQKITLEAAQQPFDLTTAPLLRVTLVHCSEQEYTLLLVMHHIIADGWSMGVLIHELTVLYQAFTQSQPLPLPELTIQYADYTIWQRQWLDGEVLETQLAYWQKQLKNLPALELPTNYHRPTVQTFQGKRQPVVISESLTAALKLLSQQQGVTLFMTLLAAFDVLLCWYTNEDDIVVGTDIANRNQVQTHGLIGFFVNQLVLRTNLSDNPTFIELLTQVRQITIEAYTNQDVPFDKLVEVLNPERTLNRTPLFQVKLVLQNTPMPPVTLFSLSVGVTEVDNHTAKYDLLLNFTETEQGLIGWLEYSTDLFAVATITRLLSNLVNLLETLVVKPQLRINELKEILTQADQKHQLAQEQELKQARLQKFQNLKRKVITEEFAL
ncbi:AMP-binding protein [Nostocaceae cyanobacterium CENA357]|uniref:AMP-binding protein n=1 Tax=Atlanticothrix silvestris CENA357 TaxID=1725252 RepID=A0A8J7HFT0_9CYAN|nr:condensation domain-containing protein [Atlanticothrix silvestris]MBH8554264.1 AMP-binding protein [Atlanticothrix silvestris CENA357]